MRVWIVKLFVCRFWTALCSKSHFRKKADGQRYEARQWIEANRIGRYCWCLVHHKLGASFEGACVEENEFAVLIWHVIMMIVVSSLIGQAVCLYLEEILINLTVWYCMICTFLIAFFCFQFFNFLKYFRNFRTVLNCRVQYNLQRYAVQ